MSQPADITPRDAATDIVRALRDAGHVAYFAGGCVRDELLGLTPSDYDVATDATPPRLTSLFKHTREVGAHFGVIHVHLRGHVVEVATFRADSTYSDKRRPDSVRFSDAREDAARRDFTVNALFLDPLDKTRGEPISPGGGRVIDLVGGMGDLAARVLRAVGDPERRLAEDHLRSLRAVRLAAKLSFTIDPATRTAITRHAHDLGGVSRERIGDELRQMLEHPARAKALHLLQSLELDAPALNEPHESSAAATPIVAKLPVDSPIALSLSAWALERHPDTTAAPAPLVRRWRNALCLSNDEAEAMTGYLTCAYSIRSWQTLPMAQQKRLAARRWFAGALHLLEPTAPDQIKTVRQSVEGLERTPGGIAPPPFVTGDDLVQLGLKPGPAFKDLLDRLYDAQLEGKLLTREQAMEHARRLSV